MSPRWPGWPKKKSRRSAALALLLVGLAALALPACSDPARDRFEAAEKALQEQKMDDALLGYRSIPRDFPQSRYAPTALLRQGELFGDYHRNYTAALEAYESLVFNYPRASETPRALLRKGEILLLHFLDYAAAAESLESVRRQFPEFAGMDEVLLLLAKAYAGMPDPPRQAAVLTGLIGTFPDSPRAAEGRWMLAYGYLAQGKFLEADREFRKLLYLAADRKSAARARWGMAQALEGLGRLSAAVEQYEAIGSDGEDPAYLSEKIDRLKGRLKEQ
ncbi:MAG TPA: tetratricopeptide repeat protein [Candidatus Deferrimicrobiaceae bacterium]